MELSDVRIPYGAYWSSPFAKWQGKLSELHSLRLCAHSADLFLKSKGIPADQLSHAVLGTTIPQDRSFFGTPWVMSMLGNHEVTGPTIAQACATGPRCLQSAVGEIIGAGGGAALVATCDRLSNGPMIVYPKPGASGGIPATENVVVDNFQFDPIANHAVLESAENCAARWQISTDEQHDVVVRRYEQYTDALRDDRAFQRRYMMLPFQVPDRNFRKKANEMHGDEGIVASTAEGLSRLTPVRAGGTLTYGGQTHPADGNAGMILVDKARLADFTTEPGIDIRILGFGQAREEIGYMPAAPVKAARRALHAANVTIEEIAVFKSHNPFAVNDIVFARETGVDVMKMNNFGSSLIFGHPQGPTGLRIIIEMIEELVLRGGGRGLFQGCAAGDSSVSLVIEVADRGQNGSGRRGKPQ